MARSEECDLFLIWCSRIENHAIRASKIVFSTFLLCPQQTNIQTLCLRPTRTRWNQICISTENQPSRTNALPNGWRRRDTFPHRLYSSMYACRRFVYGMYKVRTNTVPHRARAVMLLKSVSRYQCLCLCVFLQPQHWPQPRNVHTLCMGVCV